MWTSSGTSRVSFSINSFFHQTSRYNIKQTGGFIVGKPPAKPNKFATFLCPVLGMLMFMIMNRVGRRVGGNIIIDRIILF